MPVCCQSLLPSQPHATIALCLYFFFFFSTLPPTPLPSHFKPLILLWKVRVGGGLSEATLQSPWPRDCLTQAAHSMYQEVIICIHPSMSRPGGASLRSLPGSQVDPFTLTMTGMCQLSLTFVLKRWFSFGSQLAWGGSITGRHCRTVACIRESRDALQACRQNS